MSFRKIRAGKKKAKEREGSGLQGERAKSWQEKIIVKNNSLILECELLFLA